MEEKASETVAISKAKWRDSPSSMAIWHIGIQAALFIVIFACYLYHCSPSAVVSSEFAPPGAAKADSLSLINQADHNSMSFPSTIPLWFILARIVRHIPFGDFVFRLNMMSAFFGALTSLFLFKIIAGYKHNRYPEERSRTPKWFLTQEFPGIITAFLFAFSYPFWMLSEYSGPDTLQMAMLIMTFYFLLAAFRARRFRYFYYCTIALALGISAYPLMTVISLAVMFIVIIKTLQIKGRRHVAAILAIYAAGFLLHLYHPLMFVMQEQGEYPQFENIFMITLEVIVRQLASIKAVLSLRTLFWLPIVCFPLLVFVRWNDTGSLKTASHFLRISLIFISMILGVFFMLNIDRRVVSPMQMDLMMYGSLNPFPFTIISLWMGYLFGYVMLLATGGSSAAAKTTKLNYRPEHKYGTVAASVLLMILLAALPIANLWLNSAKVMPFAEMKDIFAEASSVKTEENAQSGSWYVRRAICGCSMRDFRLHEEVGIKLLSVLKKMKYEPSAIAIKADAIATNSFALATLIEHLRTKGDILYKHVVYIDAFNKEEWYYNRIMSHAFRIDPQGSWDTADKYSIVEATAESVMKQDTSIAFVLNYDKEIKSGVEKFYARFNLPDIIIALSMIQMKEALPASMVECAQTEFDEGDITWFGKKEPDSLNELAMFFDLAQKPENADELYVFLLKLNPKNVMAANAIYDRLMFYAQIGKMPQALKLAKEAVKLKTDFLYLQEALDGFTYYSMKPQNLSKSIQSFKNSLKMQPNLHAFSALTIILYEKGDYAEAYEYAKQALGFLGDNPDAKTQSKLLDMAGWTAFKLAQMGETDKLKEAEESLKAAYEADETSGDAMLHYGAFLYTTGDEKTRGEGLALIRKAKNIRAKLATEADEIMREIDENLREKRK